MSLSNAAVDAAVPPAGVPDRSKTNQLFKDILSAVAAVSGSQFFLGVGSPDDEVGNNNDTYLNTETRDLYKKSLGVWGAPVISLSGVTNHGDLDGLDEDDHSQYLTSARGDLRYYTKSQVDNAIAAAILNTANGAVFATGDNIVFATGDNAVFADQ